MTERQRQLLLAIIEEFMETANAVGSMSLSSKNSFDISPATIRNEMAELVRQGYLEKPHSSSGRIPTTLGLRYFIEELLIAPEEMDLLKQESVKQKLHENRFEKETLIRTGLRELVNISGNAAVALVNRDIYYAGLSEMLNIPEFQEHENLQRIIHILEDYAQLSKIFNQNRSDKDVKVLIGEETGMDIFRPFAVVFSELRLHGDQKGYIAVIGPNRLPYRRIFPAVSMIAGMISAATKGW